MIGYCLGLFYAHARAELVLPYPLPCRRRRLWIVDTQRLQGYPGRDGDGPGGEGRGR